MEDHERRARIRHTNRLGIVSLFFSIMISVTLLSFLSITEVVSGWSLSVMHGGRTVRPYKARLVQARGRTGFDTSLYAKNTEEDDLISQMDARILQSMLQDNKLDLEQESNMKKLLERGIRKEDEEEDPFGKKEEIEEEETYSSQVIKTLADTKFWKAFQRNAGEVLESVAIAVTNEIEKGAKVLVGLGFFAWDRAKKDVARALPTAASIPKKKVFQLGETSSYVEPKVEEVEEMTPSQRAKSIRQEFTTPADEISAVTAEISKIFQRADRQVALQSQVDKSQDTRNPFFAAFVEEKEFQEQKSSGGDSTPFYASASLSSTASRGSSRLDAAFKRAQKTKLAREKENLAMKGNRLASAAIDSAYQVKAEINKEDSVPGYKTKQLRESTVDVSKRIAGAAKKTAGFLGGASTFLLGNSGDKQQQLPQAGTPVNENQVKADPVDFLDDSSYFAFKREEPQENAPPIPQEDLSGDIVIEDNKVINTDQPESGGGAFGFLNPFAKREQSEESAPLIPQEDLSGGIVIEDNKVIDTDQPESGGGAFGFLNPFAKRDNGNAPSQGASTVASSTPAQQAPLEMEIITEAEVVMGNTDNFNVVDVDDAESDSSSSNKDYFTTNGYLDNMEASTPVSTDDGLRQVTAEVISDDDFDDTVFAQATAVDNMSAEELLKQQASEEAEDAEPSFVTKATLRTLDVAFLVVEKGVGLAPTAFELAKRVASRTTDAKLKSSTGSQIGWEFHNGNIRGDNRY